MTVYISQGPLGAEVALGKLKSLGIPGVLKYETLSRVLPVTVGALGRYEVQVPAEYAQAARQALQREEGDAITTSNSAPM